MKRVLVAMMLAVAVAPAHAQMAGAIGKPLGAGDLATGTVSVRVIAGDPQKNVIGTDVTLVVNGATRQARTGNDGRAVFKDLPPGAQIQAKVLDEDKKEISSETFPLPAQGGVKVMLTTLPMSGGGGAPMMGGGGGGQMPNPREMSGEPRPEQSDPPGTLTARVTFDDFGDKAPPANQPVVLVGYKADDRVDMQIANTDAQGRATFKGLDRSGATSYFAMTLLERNGKLERLTSIPAVLDSRSGVRVILSGEKRDSTNPPVDDLTRFEKQEGAPAAGKVRIVLEGGVDGTALVKLVELAPGGHREFGSARPSVGAADPSEVDGEATFTAKADVPPNTVVVMVQGGINQTMQPIAGVAVNVAPTAAFAQEQGQIDGTTNDKGTTTITVDPAAKGPFVASFTINGKTLHSKPFEVTATGGVLEVEAHWSGEGKPQVEFDVTPRLGQVFVAETSMHGVVYRSVPFQPLPDKGTRATLFIYPRVLFTFSLTSRVDDEYLAVNGRFEVSNNAWAPYAPKGGDGLIIPLPKGFVGGLVAEKDQGDVAIVPGEGFRIVRPLAPGQRAFHGAFSLPVNDGEVTWKLDLPLGSFNSGMEILQPPGMLVQTPPGVNGQTMTVPQGTYFVLPNISILPKQSMVMKLTGLPQQPGWKVSLRTVSAILVILVVIGGIVFALMRPKGGSDDERAARRQKLLDELVELERTGKNAKRREQIMAELETLWDAA